MRLRRVRLRENGGFSVALRDGDRWVPVVPALARHRARRGADLPGLAAVAGDVVAFCAELEGIRAEVDKLLELVREENLELTSTFHPDALLPFDPVSFRDFMLYEEHAIAAARGMVKRFMPGAWRFVSAYESVFGKLPARMRPTPIWYEKPIYYMGSHINFFADGDTLPWPAYSQALDYELDVEVQINGISCGRGNTAGMRHSIGEMAAYASLGERVVPGELPSRERHEFLGVCGENSSLERPRFHHYTAQLGEELWIHQERER